MIDIRVGDCLESLLAMPSASVRCCVTSPPYWGLRDYGFAGQIGLEPTPGEYVSRLVEVFREVRRVLAEEGTLWLNLGDSYASDTKGSGGPDSSSTLAGTAAEHNGQRMIPRRMLHGLKAKDLVGIPWRVAFALQADGWYLRSDIIWAKPNPMPESVTDRPTKAHEYVFLLAKSERYYYNADAVADPTVFGPRTCPPGARNLEGVVDAVNDRRTRPRRAIEVGSTRNARSVWTIATQPYDGAHFATFPEALAERCIRAGSAVGDTVLDPFAGSGTVGAVALRWGRDAILCEGNPEYVVLARKRIAQAEAEHGTPLFDIHHRAESGA